MPSVEIDNRKVVASGSVVIHYGQDVIIYPFDDDPLFSIRFDITYYFDEGGNSSKLNLGFVDDPDNHGIIIKSRRKFRSGVHFSNARPLNFANDEQFDYYGSFAFNTFGQTDKYVTIITYTISKGSKA